MSSDISSDRRHIGSDTMRRHRSATQYVFPLTTAMIHMKLMINSLALISSKTLLF